MKKIAITQRLILNESYYERRETLDTQWGLLLNELDFLPIILPIESNYKSYFEAIKIDGIILTGGNDLNSINPNTLSYQRDIFEKEIIEYGIDNNIPILGICRGMQIIADFFNASFNKVNNQVNIKHSLVVNQKSRYSKELNRLKEVNSFHNYAVEKIGDEFIISARDNSGVIKAIEHKEYKIFGQMWHSEREEPFNSSELELIKSFFNKS